MPRKIDLKKLSTTAKRDVNLALSQYQRVCDKSKDYLIARWVAQMTAVEIHAIWECYTEKRLITALNHKPNYFIAENGIKGVSVVSSGLAAYIIRGGRRFFDFRSISELVLMANRLLGKANNPFNALSKQEREYIDCLAAIRNMVVHRSSAATIAYKNQLKKVYRILYAPKPEEFLNAIDFRSNSPDRGKQRIHGIAQVVIQAIMDSSK